MLRPLSFSFLLSLILLSTVSAKEWKVSYRTRGMVGFDKQGTLILPEGDPVSIETKPGVTQIVKISAGTKITFADKDPDKEAVRAKDKDVINPDKAQGTITTKFTIKDSDQTFEYTRDALDGISVIGEVGKTTSAAPKDQTPQASSAPLPSEAIIPLRCPPKVAFWRMPSVKEVPAASDPEESSSAPSTSPSARRHGDSLTFWAQAHGLPLFDARFDQPATFPLPAFGFPPDHFGQDGVVIYEGMQLRAVADGQYEVRFTASLPRTPVTLRMQLSVWTPRQPIALTLPPIAIVPETDFSGNYDGAAYQVRVRGFSRLLASEFPALAESRLTRTGTARFGSWPEGINKFAKSQPLPITSIDTSPGSSTSTGSAAESGAE